MHDLFNTATFSITCKRDNNEDSIFPTKDDNSPLKNLFVVCDGVGGSSKGEVASRLICTELNNFFVANNITFSNFEVIQSAVKFVVAQFDRYIKNHNEAHGMASTMTLLHLHENGATVAHIGDSRVYLFREGKIIFRTKDHSLVQELFDLGEITIEQMKVHPQRNAITRAVQVINKRTIKADVSIIRNLQVGDIFFMCTDGVLESCSEDSLMEFFKTLNPVDDIAHTIRMKCAHHSNDNSSAYLVQVNELFIDIMNKN